MSDLFNNPMVEAAKKAMPDDLKEKYEQMGEYMYNRLDYRINEMGSKIKDPTTEELAMYAVQGLRSGIDPQDLTDKEITALIQVYGDKWYEKFDIMEHETRKPFVHLATDLPEALKNGIPKISRQQKRALERKLAKMDKKGFKR